MLRPKLISSRLLLLLTLHTLLLLLLHRGGHHHLLLLRTGSPVVTRVSSDRATHALLHLLLLLLRRYTHVLLSWTCGAHELVGVLILVLLHGRRTRHHAGVLTSRLHRAHHTSVRHTMTNTNLMLIGRLDLLLSLLPVVWLRVHLLLLGIHAAVHHGLRTLLVVRHRRLAHTIHAIGLMHLHRMTSTHLILSLLLPLHMHLLLVVEVALWRRPLHGLLSLGILLLLSTLLPRHLLVLLRLLLLLSSELFLLLLLKLLLSLLLFGLLLFIDLLLSLTLLLLLFMLRNLLLNVHLHGLYN